MFMGTSPEKLRITSKWRNSGKNGRTDFVIVRERQRSDWMEVKEEKRKDSKL